VLGIDPGLTRCGVGIVDVEPSRHATLVYVGVIRTPPDMALEERLLTIGAGIAELLDEYQPRAVALERVFAQHNLRTVMGTAQASGVALHAAAARGLSVGLHTPSEVKAAVTGYGSADKKQVATMVQRVLRLDAPPTPADASDALALALCHAWRGGEGAAGVSGANSGSAAGPASGSVAGSQSGSGKLTPAQEAWRAAEKAARS
ncbi:MAG TPA: crossover junction endodeoxyribonuclease RuvC, partial [Galbitalea sp.]